MLRDQKVSEVNLISSSVSWLLRKGRGTQATPSATGTIIGGLADERPVFTVNSAVDRKLSHKTRKQWPTGCFLRGLHRSPRQDQGPVPKPPARRPGPGAYHRSPRSSRRPNVEFLFVVLEAVVFEDELVNNLQPEADMWGTLRPPKTWRGFCSGERVGGVFRYKNGTATRAPEYDWFRPGPGQPGGIVRWNFAALDEDGCAHPTYEPCRLHTTRTVFDCGPFLSTVINLRDASVNPMNEEEDGDYHVDEEWEGVDESEGESNHGDVDKDVSSSVKEVEEQDIDPTDWAVYECTDWHGERDDELWFRRRFEHDWGVSRISVGDEAELCVAASNPSWVPTIVSESYLHPGIKQASRGLGGDMATLIGLLALTQAPGHCDDAFAPGVWKRNIWRGKRHPDACEYAP
ncbi:hypothetical protein DL767_011266 [Monosporascus sp. MG133]|nr:hypothetical protein DL767_011266 [Monosporascus sp. MG133]